MSVPVALAPPARQQFLDSSGNPLAGGKLYTYAAGTDTPQAAYTDSTGNTAHPNPIVLDSGGFATIWLAEAAYKFIAKDSAGVTQWTVDNVRYWQDLTQVNVNALSYKVSGTTVIDSSRNVIGVGGTFSGAVTADSVTSGTSNRVRKADGFSGANAGAKIVAAITALPVTGGTVDARGFEGEQTATVNIFNGVTKPVTLLLGAATFTCSAPWVAETDGIKIVGAGRGVTIIKQADSANTGLGVVTAGNSGHVNGFLIRDLTIDANKAGNTTHCAGLHLKNVSGIADNVEVKNSPDIGFGTGDGATASPTAYDVTIQNCWSHDNEGNGFDGNNISDVRYINNRSEDNGTTAGGVGFYCASEAATSVAADVKYIGNTAVGNGGSGFMVASSNGSTLRIQLIGNSSISNVTVGGSAGNAYYLAQSGSGSMAGPFLLRDNIGYDNAVNSIVTFGTVAGIEDAGNSFSATAAYYFGSTVEMRSGNKLVLRPSNNAYNWDVYGTGNDVHIKSGSGDVYYWNSDGSMEMRSGGAFRLRPSGNGYNYDLYASGNDLLLKAGATDAYKVTSDRDLIKLGTHGEAWTRGELTEEITLSTTGLTTDSSANLLPANSIIEAVVARVTTTIDVVTDWALGDSAQGARFTSANSTLTAGTTTVGLNHQNPAVASADLGPVQTSAAKLRVTCTGGGNPTAGKIRVTVYYRQFTAPTS